MKHPSPAAAAVLCAAALVACLTGTGSTRGAVAFAKSGMVPSPKSGMVSSRYTRASSVGEPGRCLRRPGRLAPGVAPESGARLTVEVGVVVYVELVEPERYLSWPSGTKPPPRVFPWAAVRSSDRGVLRRIALRPSNGVSTLPLRAYAFRAQRPGAAVLRAPVVTAWRRAEPARRRGLRPYRATVIVTR